MVFEFLQAITVSGKSFQWGKNQQKAFDEMKRNISQAPMLALTKLNNPIELEIYASGYYLEEIMMQGGRPIFYHYEVFHGAFRN
jgi:hypothetical protein